MQALLVCEAAQKRSTVFAASRFACLALYGLLGAAGPAAANFDALSIKFIQHDTITGISCLPKVVSFGRHLPQDLHYHHSLASRFDSSFLAQSCFLCLIWLTAVKICQPDLSAQQPA